MLSVNVKSRLNFTNIDEAKRKAVKAVAMSLKKEADPYVPYRTGQLFRSTVNSDFDNGILTYDTPYAHDVYFAGNRKFNTDIHPLACARWADVAWNAKKDRFIKLFNNEFVRNLKK